MPESLAASGQEGYSIVLVVRNSVLESLKAILGTLVFPLIFLVTTGGKLNFSDTLTLAVLAVFAVIFARPFWVMVDRREKIAFETDGVSFPGSKRSFFGWDEILSVTVLQRTDLLGILVIDTTVSLMLKDGKLLELKFFPLEIEAEKLKRLFDKELAKRKVSMATPAVESPRQKIEQKEKNQPLKQAEPDESGSKQQKSAADFDEISLTERIKEPEKREGASFTLTNDPFLDEILILGLIIFFMSPLLLIYASFDDHNGHITFINAAGGTLAMTFVAMIGYYLKGISRGRRFSNTPPEKTKMPRTKNDRPRLTKMKKRGH